MIKLLVPIIIACASLSPEANAENPLVKQFIEGKKTTYSTKDHAKAKGLNMTISYPKTWVAEEGNRPNIVQRFSDPEKKGSPIVVILTKSLPTDITLTEDEQKDLLTVDALKEAIPKGGIFISGEQTKIEGLPATILQYSQRAERAGMVFETKAIFFSFISGSTLVQIQCQVGNLAGAPITAQQQMAESKPLFTLIASSIVLPDRWK